MRAHRTSAMIAVGAAALAACGSASADQPVAAPAAPPQSIQSSADTEMLSDDPAQAAEAPTPSAEIDPTGPESLPVGDGPTAGDETSTDQRSDDRPAAEPEPEPEPEPAEEPASMAWPNDGCSADNSATPAVAADGPPPLLELRAESADSPLPEVAVRRINCSGGWANFRNELPSDRPLLVWFWAPH